MEIRPTKINRSFLITLTLLSLLTLLFSGPLTIWAQGVADIFAFDVALDSAGFGANVVTLADMDGDGDLDAYLGRKDSSTNKIYINNNGSFTDRGQVWTERTTFAVALGDLDNNGTVDAFVGNANGETDLLEMNDGTGWMSAVQSVPGSDAYATYAVDLGDVDLDGDLDALIATSQNSHLWINQGGFQGGTVGQFQPGQTLGTAAGADVVLADLDNDTDLDAIVLTNFNQAIQIWVNNGGVFLPWATLPFESGTIAGDLAVGKINDDDLLDIYIATPVGNDLIGLNNGSNSFNPTQSLPIGMTQDVILSDVDTDGDLDAVVAVQEYGNSGDQLWLNDGGTFSQGQILTDNRSVSVAAGDLDGDISPDLLFATIEGPKKIWINQTIINGTDVSITITGPGVAFTDIHGARATLNVDISAQGQTDATNVELVPIIKTRSGGSWSPLTCSLIPTELPCLPVIPSGTTKQLKLKYEGIVDLPNQYLFEQTDRISVNANEFDPNLENNTAEWTTYIYNCGLADCFLEKALCKGPLHNSRMISMVGQTLQTVPHIPLYYQIRDDVLKPTANGRHYHDLYYTHDAELQSLILNDNALLNEGLYVLEQWQPNLQALLDGQGETTVITSQQISAMSSFLTSLYLAGSPTLQQVITEELDRLGPLDHYIGMTMSEAREKVVGIPQVYLPILLK